MLIVSVTLPLLVLMLLILIMHARRRSKSAKPDTSYDFAVDELMRLLRSGQISQEEFEQARASVLSRKKLEPDDSSRRGFEVLPPRKPMIQSLEERISP